MAVLTDPVIFVPGVLATDLRDLYQTPPATIWSLLRQDYERAALHPEDLRYEAQLPAQVRPDQVYEISYREMILDLRHDLSPRADRATPVYIFGYDWRQPLEVTQQKLRAFVDEVIEKTVLTRHYYVNGYADRRTVNLLGHSMGGLVITGYLADAVAQGFAARVNRVATIATPYRGSLNAVERLIKGTSNRREREAARLTPSLYYLLPSFSTGIEIAPDLPQTDLFDARLWQESLVETLQENLRLYGSGAIRAADLRAKAEALLAQLLGDAKKHRAGVEAFQPASVGLQPDDWLSIVGVGEATRVGLRITKAGGKPLFDLSDTFVTGKNVIGPDPSTGDGTVSWAGSQRGFATKEIVVSHRNFGILELKDRGLDQFAALHGILPNMNKLQGDLVRHFA